MQKEAIIKILVDQGFTVPQAKVYCTLLGKDLNLTELAKSSKVNRSFLYEVINDLKSKKLIEVYVKNNRTLYKAVNPEDLLKLRKESFKQLESNIPFLKSVFDKNILTHDLDIKVYCGSKEIQKFLIGSCNEIKEVCIIGNSSEYKNAMPKWSEAFSKYRKKNNIKAKIIVEASEETLIYLGKNKKDKYNEVRVLPLGLLLKGACDIFGSTVVLYDYNGNDIKAIVIKNNTLSKLLKTMFEISWVTSDSYTKNLLK